MKNLKRSLKYLAVFSEPLSDDTVPRTLSSGDGVESEELGSLRKRRDKENGTGRGKGRPDGLRRNRNPLDCPSDGPGKGKGRGRDMGRSRQAQIDNKLSEFVSLVSQAVKVGLEIEEPNYEVQLALGDLLSAERVLTGLGREAQLQEYNTPLGYDIKQYS